MEALHFNTINQSHTKPSFEVLRLTIPWKQQDKINNKNTLTISQLITEISEQREHNTEQEDYPEHFEETYQNYVTYAVFRTEIQGSDGHIFHYQTCAQQFRPQKFQRPKINRFLD